MVSIVDTAKYIKIIGMICISYVDRKLLRVHVYMNVDVVSTFNKTYLIFIFYDKEYRFYQGT